MNKISINMATNLFEQKLIDLINNTGLPEVNVLFVLKNVENLVHSELVRKIELENEQNKPKNDAGDNCEK